ncbi:MAG: cupin domain-containing protein [Phycisphaerales bacterium]|jgi:uncharacterized protein|nr:cupin domain-containing protein [Phycisphaerales bacterium]MBT7170168.1 cupin domain-containing protein [Phycisphaerales bacterium]
MDPRPAAQDWIDRLELAAHPEGGWYREVYRSEMSVSAEDFDLPHRAMTSIYYLLAEDAFSAFHRLRQDEVFHFYAGRELTIHQITPEGDYRAVTIGPEGPFQCVIPAGTLFGAALADPAGYALVGCTVAPGFEFSDFSMPTRAELLKIHPQHRSVIERLTRE